MHGARSRPRYALANDAGDVDAAPAAHEAAGAAHEPHRRPDLHRCAEELLAPVACVTQPRLLLAPRCAPATEKEDSTLLLAGWAARGWTEMPVESWGRAARGWTKMPVESWGLVIDSLGARSGGSSLSTMLSIRAYPLRFHLSCSLASVA